MLSTRGCTYADLDLAAGYQKKRGPLYNKNEYPKGLVSLANAENACSSPGSTQKKIQTDATGSYVHSK
jgi:hypothetical protein